MIHRVLNDVRLAIRRLAGGTNGVLDLGTGAAPYGLGLKGDKIHESTAGAGVTVDGTLLKDGGITAAAAAIIAADADKIKAGGIIVPDYFVVTIQHSIATQMVSSNVLVAHRALQLVGASQVHGVVAGQACKLLIEKCTSTTAPGSGTGLLTNNTNAGFDLTATANTVQAGTLTATAADLQFAAGDRVSFKYGTSTSCVGCVTTMIFKPI